MISMKEAYWTERRRAEKAEADLADCTQKLFIETEGCAWAVALCDLLEAERDRLRETLAWYAAEAHYYNTGTETAMDDKGQRARRALKRKEDGLNVP